MVSQNKYDIAYLEMAEAFSKTSVAERLKVGCVIVRDGQPISLGINGTPSGWYTNNCEDENGETSWFTKHAEVQALNKLRKSTESSVGADMYITHSPCKMCCLDIIDAGIKRIVFKESYRDTSGIEILKQHGIIVEQIT
jgi:dCMP deaminase